MFQIINSRKGFFRQINENCILNDIKDCIKEGADVHYQNKSGNTLLHVAIRKGYLKIIDYLLSLSQRWNISNKRNLTPYDLAKENPKIIAIFHRYSLPDVELKKNEKDDNRIVYKRRRSSSNNETDFIITNNEDDGSLRKIARTRGSLTDFPSHHKSSGLKHSLHGVIYQLKLHMLIMKRALIKGYNFRLAAEMDEAEKFDDLVFIYEDDERDVIKYHFLQAKHKQDETIKITSKDLLTENNDGEYGLSKYFTSFRKILRSCEIKGECVCFILCTNISFDIDELSNKGFRLLTIKDNDELLDTESIKCGSKYHFRMNDAPIRDEIYELLKCTSDLYCLAKLLYKHSTENLDVTLRIPIFKLYHGVLISEKVLSLTKETRKNYATYTDDFLNKSSLLSNNAQLLRDLLIKFSGDENTFIKNFSTYKLAVSSNFGHVFEIDENPQLTDCKLFAEKFFDAIKKANTSDSVIITRETGVTGVVKDNLNKIAGHLLIKDNDDIVVNSDFLKKITLPGNLMELKQELTDLFQSNNINVTDLMQYKFKIYKYRTCEKDQIGAKQHLPSYFISDKEIEHFFEKLIFAVNQPNEIELEEIIKREIGNDSMFNMLNVDLISDSFQKELLDWFKEKGCVKGKEGRFLSTDDAVKLFQDIEDKINTIIGIGLSLTYPRQLSSFEIKFTTFNEEIRTFIETVHVDRQILNIECENVFFTSLKINQVLNEQNACHLTKQDSIIFINIDTVLKAKDYVIKAFKSKKSHHLLIISCDNQDNAFETVLSDLLCVINDNKRKKMILISNMIRTKRCDTLLVQDAYNFNDFSLDTTKLLENKLVYYQGNEVKIGSITKNLEHIIDIDTLVKLIHDDSISVGKQLKGLKEVGEYYVERIFLLRQYVDLNYLETANNDVIIVSNINEEILQQLYINRNVVPYEKAIIDNVNLNNQIILINERKAIEEKYEKLLNLINSERIVYCFKYDSNKLLLQRNRGSITELCKYLTNSNESFTELDMLNKNGVIILSNIAGMGKSTSTICLSNKLKHLNPYMWVLRINLNQCTDVLEDELYFRAKNQQRFNSKDSKSAVQFLINYLIPNECTTNFEKRFFELLTLENKKVALYFDAFDEISPNYEHIVLELIDALSSTNVKLIFVTTRPTSERVLENKFNCIAYNLQTLTIDEQIKFIKNKWCYKLKQLKYPINKKIIYNFVKTLMTHINNTINDKDKKLTGNPLLSAMIADVYFEKFLKCYQNNEEHWNLIDKFDIVDLYEKFIKLKFDIYNKEKKKEITSNLSVKYDNESLFKNFLTIHQHAALYTMLAKPELYSLLTEKQRNDIKKFLINVQNGIERTGIITQIIDNKPEFLHTTLKEYFAALFLIEQLQNNWRDEELLLIKILVQSEYEIMRLFFNGLLTKYENIKLTVANCWDDKIVSTCNDDEQNLLQVSCKEGNERVVKFLLEIIKPSTLSKLINVRDRTGNTCVHYAVYCNNESMVKMLLEHDADPNEIDYNRFAPIHHATRANQENIVKILISFKAKKFLTNYKDRQPLHYAAKYGHINLFKMLTENFTSSYYRDIDMYTNLPIDLAAKYQQWNIIEWWLDNIDYDYGSIQSKNEINVFTCAAKFGKLNIVNKLLEKARDVYIKEIKRAIRFACGNNQLTMVKHLITFTEPPYDTSYLLAASFNKHVDIIKYLISINIRLKLEDNWVSGDDIFHHLLDNDRIDILKLLLSDEQNFEAVDDYGTTLLLQAAAADKWNVVNWLINEKPVNIDAQWYRCNWTTLHLCVDSNIVDEETIRNILNHGAKLVPDGSGLTAIDLAEKNGHTKIVEMLKQHYNKT